MLKPNNMSDLDFKSYINVITTQVKSNPILKEEFLDYYSPELNLSESLYNRRSSEIKAISKIILKCSQNKITEDKISINHMYDFFRSSFWNLYQGKSSSYYNKISQGVVNSILTAYYSHKLEDLKPDTKVMFLGRRSIPAVSISKSLAKLNLQITTDRTEAEAFIVGDILTEDESMYNLNGDYPFIMEQLVESYYISNIKYPNSEEPNVPTLHKILTSKGASDKTLSLLAALLSKMDPAKLPAKLRLKLLTFYNKFKNPSYNSGFSYKDKKHRTLIKLLSTAVLPEHKFFIQPKFLNTANHLRISGTSEIRQGTTPMEVGVGFFGQLITEGYGSGGSLAIPMISSTGDFWSDDDYKSTFDGDEIGRAGHDVIDLVNFKNSDITKLSLREDDYSYSYSVRNSTYPKGRLYISYGAYYLDLILMEVGDKLIIDNLHLSAPTFNQSSWNGLHLSTRTVYSNGRMNSKIEALTANYSLDDYKTAGRASTLLARFLYEEVHEELNKLKEFPKFLGLEDN